MPQLGDATGLSGATDRTKQVVTFTYRAPEVWLYHAGKAPGYGAAIDVWATALVLVNLIAGELL